MPSLPARQCSGCRGIVPGGQDCPTCTAKRTQHRRQQDKQRGSSTARGYGARWQKARKAYLAAHPLCAMCAARGQTTAATELDHIIPHKGDMALFWDRKNWQGLCKQDHSRKTATEDGGFGHTNKGKAGG